jgi:hypothetical protein
MSPVQIPATPPQETVSSVQTNGHAQPAAVAPQHGFSTRALHVGSEPERSAYGAVVPGIELSTTYQQSSVGVHKGFEYTRSDNVSLALASIASWQPACTDHFPSDIRNSHSRRVRHWNVSCRAWKEGKLLRSAQEVPRQLQLCLDSPVKAVTSCRK